MTRILLIDDEPDILRVLSRSLETDGYAVACARSGAEGIAAFEDCKAFFDRTYDALERDTAYRDQPEFLGADAIGSWIVWNLVGHAPDSTDERRLVRVLGSLVTHSFFTWWSE